MPPPFLRPRFFTLFLARHFAGSDKSVLRDLRLFSLQAERAVARSPEMAGLGSILPSGRSDPAPFAAETPPFCTMFKQRMREFAPHYIE